MAPKSRKPVLERLAAVAAALAVWEVAALLLGQKFLLASPVDVAVRLASIWREPDFFRAVGFTLARIAGGFGLGLLLGIVLGALAGRFHAAEVLLRPYMVTVKSVPVASFIVIALVWLTAARLSVFISLLMVLPVVYNAVLTGVKDLDPKLSQMADVFAVRPGQRLLYVTLPQLMPQLLSAISVSLGFAWKAGVAAEVIGIPTGSIGEKLYYAKVYLNSTDLLAWTVVIVLASVGMEKLLLLLLRTAWGKAVRS